MDFSILKDSEPFWFNVGLVRVQGNGVARSYPFEVKFNRFKRSELNELRQRSQNMPEDGDSLERDTDYIMELACDWKLKDGKTEIPFNRENLLDFLDAEPSAAAAIVEAFFRATLAGGAKRGNL